MFDLPETVVLPTPPFPEATSTIFFTPSIGLFFGSPLAIILACLSSGLFSTDFDVRSN